MSPIPAQELATVEAAIDAFLAEQLADNPAIDAVDKGVDGPRSWFIRVRGEEKDVYTIRFHLDQRTLSYETYVMPAPEEQHEAFYAHLLGRNRRLYGASFAIGEEGAIFLQGQLDNRQVLVEGELDRILGSLYQWVEAYFRPALRIGFASKFS